METHAPINLQKLRMHTSLKPFFGICTAFHLQAYTRGMPLIKIERSESGLTAILATEPGDPIFKGLLDEDNKFMAENMHNDSIDLPPGFDLLASTEHCPIQLIKHKELPLMYCSQFHPEQRAHTQVMLENFLDLANALCSK